MSVFGIKDWHIGETFAIVNSCIGRISVSDYESKRHIELRKLANGVIETVRQNSIERYDCVGEWPALRDGDILYIKNNGLVQLQYIKGQAEVDLFVTNKCNSNCIMCPLAETVRKRETPRQIDWIMDYIELLPEDIPYINITGGEPTLEKERFVTLMKRLRDKFQHSEFQLLTNGRSLADKNFLIRLIKSMPYNIRIAIPLHSSCEQVHDAITQAKGSCLETDYGIRNLLDMQQKVEIRIVLSRLNIATVEQTVRYIVKNYQGVFVVNFIGMEMMGNAARNKDLLWDEYASFFRQIRSSIRYLISCGIDTQLYNFPLCAVDSGYWPIVAKSITGYKIRYKEECANCIVKDICGGFFFSTLKLINPEVQVIKEK